MEQIAKLYANIDNEIREVRFKSLVINFHNFERTFNEMAFTPLSAELQVAGSDKIYKNVTKYGFIPELPYSHIFFNLEDAIENNCKKSIISSRNQCHIGICLQIGAIFGDITGSFINNAPEGYRLTKYISTIGMNSYVMLGYVWDGVKPKEVRLRSPRDFTLDTSRFTNGAGNLYFDVMNEQFIYEKKDEKVFETYEECKEKSYVKVYTFD